MAFLKDAVHNKVGLCLSVDTLEIDDTKVTDCWGGVKAKQYPDELSKLLKFIYDHSEDINSYCEIGVERGGTFYTIDSFLRAINPNFEGSLGIDITDKIVRKHDFESYHKKYPTCRFEQISSKKFMPHEKFDMSFIDGDHSYEGVLHDFNLMKSFTNNYMAFHDIVFEKADVKDFWNNIKKEYDHKEFINKDLDKFPVPLGIGVIDVKGI